VRQKTKRLRPSIAFAVSEAQAARQQTLKDLEHENKALPDKIRQIRGGQ
jgi:hypothetical protein